MRRTKAEWMRKRLLGACVAFLSSTPIALAQSPQSHPSQENGSVYGRPVVVRTAFAAPLRPVTPVINAGTTDLQTDATIPELVPAPTHAHEHHAAEHHVSPAPHGHTISSGATVHGYVMSHDPLWAGYQSDKQCGCQPNAGHHHRSQKQHRSPIRKALNKLSAGFDLIMYGRQGSACGCESGNPCDAPACEASCGLEPSCDGACDAMLLPADTTSQPAHTHAPATLAPKTPEPKTPQPKTQSDAAPQVVPPAVQIPESDRVQIRTESSRSLEPITAPQRRTIRGIPLPPAEPAPVRPGSPRPSSENPFLDDPLP